MIDSYYKFLTAALIAVFTSSHALADAATNSQRQACEPAAAGNPFVEGWYADPDMRVYGSEYWVYPTSSLPYDEQTYLDAFSSKDLVHWTKHPRILDKANVTWARRAIWAPSPVYRNGHYYLYFGANDIQNNNQLGGIGVATAAQPGGPFIDALGRPLIDRFVNGAQPIDQNVFIDDDGQAYIYYGGWGHCNVAKLNTDMISLGTLPDGSVFKEITPYGYVEGPLMFKRKGVYYLMWSEGGWTGPDYRVAYAIASSPLGPFYKQSTILSQNTAIGTGSGHNTVVNVPGTDDWYIFYHRHPLGETDGNHRVLAYEPLKFTEDGTIKPVAMTTQDNFCDGNSVGWKTYGGPWSVLNEELAVASHPDAKALLNTNHGGVSYEADVTVGEAGDAGLLLRTQSAGEGLDAYRGYYVGLDAAADRIVFGRADAGTWTELARASQTLDSRRPYHLKVIALGADFEVYLEQQSSPILRVRDSVYARGAVGVRAHASEAHFDNINATLPKAVVFYQDANFGGTGTVLGAGSYTLAQLQNEGFINDAMSSVRIPEGWRVDVFEHDNFGGSRWQLMMDTPWLVPEANDQMSSVRIFAP